MFRNCAGFAVKIQGDSDLSRTVSQWYRQWFCKRAGNSKLATGQSSKISAYQAAYSAMRTVKSDAFNLTQRCTNLEGVTT